jgi:large subunit ribosomal protein L3
MMVKNEAKGVNMAKREPSMKFALLGRKIGMTQIFAESGEVIPVTVIEAGPCKVLQIKSQESDGYSAIQIGFADKKKNRVKKAEAGHAAKTKSPAKKIIQEFRVDAAQLAEFTLGQELTADLLKNGDRIDVSAVSVGKGFKGVMVRHNFRGARHSHNHEFFRHGGSIGMRSTPGRVFKGKKMPGQHGNKNRTVQNLEVVAIEADRNFVLIRGGVPGHKNAFVTLRGSVKGGFPTRSMTASPKAAEAEAPAAETNA